MNKQIVYLLRAPAFLIFALGAATLPAQANEQQMMSGPQMMQSPAATDRAQMPYMPGPGMMNPGAGGGYGPGMMGGGCGMMAPMMGMMMRGGQGMGPGMMMGGGHGMGPGMMMGGGYGMGPGMMMGGGHGMGPGMMMGYRSPALELSPDQAKKIDAIRSDFFKATYPLTREMFRERAKMEDANWGGDADPAELKKAYARIAALQEKMFDARIDAQKRMGDVLTKEQRQRIWGAGMMGF